MKRLNEEHKAGSNYVLGTVGFVIVVLLNLLFIDRLYGIYIFDDQLGYWTHAAHLAGYDWSGITSWGMSWYSYGYSFLLTVCIQIAKLFDGSMATAYRLAILQNALCCGLIFLLGYKYLKARIKKSQWIPFCGALMVSCYGDLVFYSRTAWTECILAFLTMTIVFLVVFNAERKSSLIMLLSSFLIGYMYVVHNRTLSMVVAFLAYAPFVIVTNKKKLRTTLALIAPVLLILIANKYFSGYFKNRIWGTLQQTSDINNASFALGNIKMAFSIKGIIAVLRCMLGQLWYIGTSSFGMAYLGIAYCFAQTGRAIKNRRINEFTTYGFVTLAFLLTLGVSVAWWFTRYIPELDVGAGTGRMSNYFYGRYIDNWIPVLIMFGCLEIVSLWKNRKRGLWLTIGIAVFFIAATISTEIKTDGQLINLNGVCVPSTAALMLIFNNLDVIRLSAIIIVCFFVIMLVTGVCLSANKKRLSWLVCALFCVISVAFSFMGSEYAERLIDMEQGEYVNLADEVLQFEKLGAKSEKKTLLCNRLNNDAKMIQFMQPSWEVKFILDDDELKSAVPQADYLMFDAQNGIKAADLYKGSFSAKFLQYKESAILYKRIDRIEEDGTDDGGREIIEVPVCYLATQCGEFIDGSIVSNGKPGYLVFGPYTTLSSGTYTLHMQGRLMGDSTANVISLDVKCDMGEGNSVVTNPEDQILKMDGEHYSTQIDFALGKDATYSEFRMRIEGPGIVSVDRVFLTVEPRAEA